MMKLKYKYRRKLALLILIVGLPLYIVAVVSALDFIDRQTIFIEVSIYLLLGIVWALPFKFIFQGIGQSDPDQK